MTKTIHSSVYWRLTRIFLLTLISGLMVGGAAFRWAFRPDDHVHDLIESNGREYATLIEREWGLPVDPQKIQSFSNRTGIDVRVDAQQNNTNPQTFNPSHIPDPETLQNSVWHHRGDLRFGKMGNRLFLIHNLHNPSVTYTFSYTKAPIQFFRANVLMALGLVLLVLFSGTYWAVRSLLSPIQALLTGVNRIAAGEYQYRVEESNRDEFGQIAKRFNQMAREVQHRLDSRNQLLWDVSHEIRSPVARIKVAAELLPESNHRRQIQDDLKELETLVSEVLDSERLNSPNSGVQLKLTMLTKWFLEEKQALGKLGYNPEFKIDWNPQLELNIDPNALHRVLKNLVENAYKHSPNKEVLVVADYSERNRPRFSVINRGSTIPDSLKEKIFEPFYRADSARTRLPSGGFGLGLSLCRRVAELHHAQLTVHDVPAGGTQFIFEFNESA